MNNSNSIERHSISIAESADLHSNAKKELSADEQVLFQIALARLMEKRVKLFTSNESTSLPQATAHELFLSLCYTLSLDPYDPSPQTVRRLLTEGLDEEFTHQLKVLAEKTAQCAQLCEEANRKMPPLESIALTDTLKSIQQAGARYDYRFFAHEVPAEIDYPLCHPVPEYILGIDYLNEYLYRLIIEGSFLLTFDITLCQRLLKTIHVDYRHLLVNLYEPIAINALGLSLVKKNPREVCVSEEDRAEIRSLFCECSRKAGMTLLKDAAQRSAKCLGITNPKEIAYLDLVVTELFPRISNAIRHNSLNGVFLTI